MSGWRKCDTCRKVRPTEEFDGGSPTCRACLTAPARRRSSPVARTAAPRRPAASPSAPATRSGTGSVGAGDLEVRERRAKRAAWEALAQAHPEEFALLLRDARQAEGLRPIASSERAAADGTTPPSEG